MLKGHSCEAHACEEKEPEAFGLETGDLKELSSRRMVRGVELEAHGTALVPLAFLFLFCLLSPTSSFFFRV